jgi:hypothetical protein
MVREQNLRLKADWVTECKAQQSEFDSWQNKVIAIFPPKGIKVETETHPAP